MPFQKHTTSESHKVVKRPVTKKTAGKTDEELAELRKKAGVERPTK